MVCVFQMRIMSTEMPLVMVRSCCCVWSRAAVMTDGFPIHVVASLYHWCALIVRIYQCPQFLWTFIIIYTVRFAMATLELCCKSWTLAYTLNFKSQIDLSDWCCSDFSDLHNDGIPKWFSIFESSHASNLRVVFFVAHISARTLLNESQIILTEYQRVPTSYWNLTSVSSALPTLDFIGYMFVSFFYTAMTKFFFIPTRVIKHVGNNLILKHVSIIKCQQNNDGWSILLKQC